MVFYREKNSRLLRRLLLYLKGGDAVVKRTRGRPKKEKAKEFQQTFRFDEEEAYMLGMMTFNEDKSRSEIMREALRYYYNSRNY